MYPNGEALELTMIERYLSAPDAGLVDRDICYYLEGRYDELFYPWPRQQVQQQQQQQQQQQFTQAQIDAAAAAHETRLRRTAAKGAALAKSILDSMQAQLHETLCVDYQYAEYKRRYRAEWEMAKALFDTFASARIQFPVPASMIVCYVVQTRYLDKLCDCPD